MKTIIDTFKNKSIKITDRYFYHTYSYPMYRTQHPRVPKSLVVEHPYQISYEDWSNVVKVYFDEILKELMTGVEVKLPLGMGTIQLGVIRRLKTEKIKGRDNTAYLPTLFWFKSKKQYNCTIKNKKILRMEFAKPTFMYLFRMIKDDPYSVFKWYKDPYSDNLFVNSKSKVQRW